MAKWVKRFAAMKRLSGRNRLLLATLVALVVAGVTGGIVLARGSTGTAAGPSGVLAQGQFKSVTWGTHGKAMIVREPSGKLVLRFDRSFTTRDAPELYVYLVKYDARGNRAKSKMVGALQTAFGGQHYDLPGSAAKMLGYTVEVYCAECDKTQGIAKLAPTALART
jgi:hypothetical protein